MSIDAETLFSWLDEQRHTAEEGFAEGNRRGNSNMAAANAQRIIDLGDVTDYARELAAARPDRPPVVCGGVAGFGAPGCTCGEHPPRGLASPHCPIHGSERG